MEDVIIVAVLVIILGLAIGYIVKAKKSGKKCIGCPDSGVCSGCCSGCSCGCGSDPVEDESCPPQ